MLRAVLLRHIRVTLYCSPHTPTRTYCRHGGRAVHHRMLRGISDDSHREVFCVPILARGSSLSAKPGKRVAYSRSVKSSKRRGGVGLASVESRVSL